MKKLTLIMPGLFFCASCFPQIRNTESGGIRLIHKRDYRYSKPKYDNRERSKIDTAAVFERVLHLQQGDTIYPNLTPYAKSFARFFGGGQVLFFDGQKASIEKQVNDSEAGIAGYFAVFGNRVKLEHWVNIFGDQTPAYYGIIVNDSTLKFYETYVPDCYGSFDCLERKNRYSIWKKRTIEGMKLYRPSW